MSLHADAVHVLSTWVAPDDDQERLRRTYLGHLDAHPDATWRSCHPDHLTASSLIVSADHASVLLTLHKKLGRWLQTGGHCEDADPRVAHAALREAREESGINGLEIDPEPVLLSRHEVPCGPNRPAHHLDVQYVALAPRDARAVLSDESDELEWFGVDALPGSTDRSVRDLVRAARTRLRAAPVQPSQLGVDVR